MVYIPPSKLAFEEWIHKGYQTSPDLTEVDDCPICGAPSTTCTGEEEHYGTYNEDFTGSTNDPYRVG